MNTLNQPRLMKPLFVDGMFNRAGKRIRAKHLKTLMIDGAEYPLWISAGVPEKDYPRAVNDTHYLYIQAGEYLVPCGDTEYYLEQRSAYALLNREWYGDHEGRNKFFADLRIGRSFEEADPLVKEQLTKEEAYISEHSNDEAAQAAYLKATFIDPQIATYIGARDNGGKWASFQGAAFLGELEQCDKIAAVLRQARDMEEAIRRAELAAQRKKEAEEKAEAEQAALLAIESIFLNGGTIKDAALIVKLADKYGVNIPLRTRGWMLNSLTECTISEYGGVSYRYWKSKGATGSQTIYSVIASIRKAVKTAEQSPA